MDKPKSNRRYPDYETPDPIPVAPPVGRPRNPTFEERVVQAVRGELWQRRMEEQGLETEDEANDFSIEDDELDPYTPWEAHHDVWEERLNNRKEQARRERIEEMEDAYEERLETRRAARAKKRSQPSPASPDSGAEGPGGVKTASSPQ